MENQDHPHHMGPPRAHGCGRLRAISADVPSPTQSTHTSSKTHRPFEKAEVGTRAPSHTAPPSHVRLPPQLPQLRCLKRGGLAHTVAATLSGWAMSKSQLSAPEAVASNPTPTPPSHHDRRPGNHWAHMWLRRPGVQPTETGLGVGSAYLSLGTFWRERSRETGL